MATATITKQACANYRIDLPITRRWFELGLEEQGTGYALTETTSNPDPIRPLLRWYLTQSMEEADRKNYQRAMELAQQAA
jgi:hypothetical protein